MELILALLSLLTAASGAFTGACAPDAGFEQAVQVGSVPAAAAPTAFSVAPVAVTLATLPAATPLAALPLPPAPARAASIPLYADRLIE